ncbi:hypothetical protein [Microbacterium sp.]|uniref:hypothetical protein n=1 Tax=Microbacterium sp. TaxID=51671 RepID=UPI003F70BA27
MPTIDEQFAQLQAAVRADIADAAARIADIDGQLSTVTTNLGLARQSLAEVTTDRDAKVTEISGLNKTIAELQQKLRDCAGGGEVHPEGWRPRIDVDALLASGNWVTFESLLTSSDSVVKSKDKDGGVFRAFAPMQFSSIADRAKDKGIVLGRSADGKRIEAGTYELNEPGWPNPKGAVTPDAAAYRLPKGSYGLVADGYEFGHGWDDFKPTTERTVVRVKEYTAPERNVLGGWLKAGYSGSRKGLLIGGFHVEGTEQGLQMASGGDIGAFGVTGQSNLHRIFTNLFVYNAQDDVIVQDIVSTGWSGTHGAPPGESFPVQVYMQGVRGSAWRIYTDGRREKGGPIYGAAGLTVGNAYQFVVGDTWGHHSGQAGFVAYQSIDCRTENLHVGDPSDHETRHVGQIQGGKWTTETQGDWLNHERTSGWVHNNPVLDVYAVGRPQREHVSHSGDAFTITRGGKALSAANGTLTLRNPRWSNIIRGGRLGIGTWVPYSGKLANSIEITNPPLVVDTDGKNLPFDWNHGGWKKVDANRVVTAS